MCFRNIKKQRQIKSIGSVGGKPIELTFALSLNTDSQNYLEAAKIINEQKPKELCNPIYFLTLRSIELGFKSLLKFKEGILTDELKIKYGHNIKKLMNYCINQKYLSLSKEDQEKIRSINKYYYPDKNFEYSQLGRMELYATHYYISIAEKINKRLSDIRNETNTRRYL